VQEVFLRVVRARERYEPTARFSTFLFRIAYNISVNETQRGIAREAGRVEFGSGEGTRSASPFSELADERAAAPGEELEREDIVREVRAAIGRLPENQRMALVLAKYHGCRTPRSRPCSARQEKGRQVARACARELAQALAVLARSMKPACRSFRSLLEEARRTARRVA
jgi:RNA polymerase sigma factor (sigma-70 family)